MQIDKAQLLQLLHNKGQHDQAHEAQQELPDQVDIDKHANQRSSSVSARPIYSGNSSAVWTASSSASTTLTTTAAGSPSLTPERLPAPWAVPYRRPRKV